MECDHNHHDNNARENVQSNIDQYGCHLTLVENGDYLPDFIYSIGLYQKYKHPEIICFGLKVEVIASVLNHARDLVERGEILIQGKLYNGFLEGYSVQFLAVDKSFYPNYFGYAGWFYDTDFNFPALQLVWTDKQGIFPWEETFNPDWKFRQPLLDRNIDFKFYEEKNLGVFTTKQAFEGDPILYVYHNINGDWQFHTSNNPQLADSKLVCLEEIIKLDSTINNLYHLDYGWSAWRDGATEEWEYAEDPEEAID